MSDSLIYPYLVTLGYGDRKSPTLATVVFLSENKNEDIKSVANSLLTNANNILAEKTRFDWSTLKVQGNKILAMDELAKLVEDATKGKVGVGRVTPVRLNK